MPIKVMIVDDHLLLRIGVRGQLKKSGNIEIVGEAGNGEELFAAMGGGVPDLVLLDVIMPVMDGIETAKKLRAEFPAVKILILSSETEETSILSLMEVGIDGFISKTSAKDDLVSVVETIMDGNQYFGDDISKILYGAYVAKQKAPNGKDVDQDVDGGLFTEKELEIIKLCGEGMQSKEIADKLFISRRTVEGHKSNIFRKLGLNNTVELVKYAIKKGIISL